MKEKNNPFKKLESESKAPDDLKKKVMSSVALTQLIGDFAELFTVNMAVTAGKMIPPKNNVTEGEKESLKTKEDKNDTRNDTSN